MLSQVSQVTSSSQSADENQPTPPIICEEQGKRKKSTASSASQGSEESSQGPRAPKLIRVNSKANPVLAMTRQPSGKSVCGAEFKSCPRTALSDGWSLEQFISLTRKDSTLSTASDISNGAFVLASERELCIVSLLVHTLEV